MKKKVPKPTDQYVGSRVRARRMTLGMSQEKLGDALGLTFQQVQKYEKGTNRIGASRLHHIAHILRVPIASLFEGTPAQQKLAAQGPSFEYVSDFTASSEGLALSKAFLRLDRHLKRRIVNLVEEIAEREQ